MPAGWAQSTADQQAPHSIRSHWLLMRAFPQPQVQAILDPHLPLQNLGLLEPHAAAATRACRFEGLHLPLETAKFRRRRLVPLIKNAASRKSTNATAVAVASSLAFLLCTRAISFACRLSRVASRRICGQFRLWNRSGETYFGDTSSAVCTQSDTARAPARNIALVT